MVTATEVFYHIGVFQEKYSSFDKEEGEEVQ
jgi:hypothetical protein